MARVLLVTNIFPPQIGGPATFIDRLGHSLAQRGHRVTVVCSSTGRRDPSDAARPFTVRRISLASRELYEVEVRLRLAAEMASHSLIFVNGLERYVAEVNRVLRRRYVLKIVGDTVWETARNRGQTALAIDAFQTDAAAQTQFAGDVARRNEWVHGARHVVVPSQYLSRMVQGWGVAADGITVVRNGTPASASPAPVVYRGRQPLRVLFVGRLTNWKGVETLLLAARQAEDIQVEIAGDGPEWPHLVELAAQLKLESRVKFLGRVSAAGVQEAMRRSHALVLTSLYEGLSHTLLEACAAGLPCVVSNCGGNEEVITTGHNGLTVPAQSVECLARALQTLANDEELRCRLARGAIDTARTFDLADTVSGTERLLLKAN